MVFFCPSAILSQSPWLASQVLELGWLAKAVSQNTKLQATKKKHAKTINFRDLAHNECKQSRHRTGTSLFKSGQDQDRSGQGLFQGPFSPNGW